MKPTDHSDEELMRLVQAGEKQALVLLYERHSMKVWSYLQRRVPAPCAEDLFQDCFIKIVDKKDGWRGQPFVLWLYVLLRNLVNDYYRGKKIEGRFIDKIVKDHDLKSPSIEVDEILGSMPEEKAQLLREFFSEGWSYKELAQRYEITEISVRKRLSRAIKILKGDQDNG